MNKLIVWECLSFNSDKIQNVRLHQLHPKGPPLWYQEVFLYSREHAKENVDACKGKFICIDLAAQCSTHRQHPMSLLCQDFSIISVKAGIGCLSNCSSSWHKEMRAWILNLTSSPSKNNQHFGSRERFLWFNSTVCFRSRQMFRLISMQA